MFTATKARAHISRTMPELPIGSPRRLAMIRYWAPDHAELSDGAINRRDYLLAMMQGNTDENGLCPMREWSRDCDCAEATRLVWIEPTLLAYWQRYNEMQRDAEGPFSLSPVTLEDAAEFQTEFRDRVLEAFENGNYYSV